MFKVNNRNTRTRYEICSKLTIKIPERRHWRRSGIFIVNFEQVNAGWEEYFLPSEFRLCTHGDYMQVYLAIRNSFRYQNF